MSVSVIVLSHQPGPWLEPCLASVAGQADEVVLVDNASVDGHAAVIGRRMGAVVLQPGANLGFAAGVNLAAQSARGDVFALLNDDAVASPGWLAAAERILVDPAVAAVAPKVLMTGWYREVLFDDTPLAGTRDHRMLGRQIHSVTVAGEDVLDRLAGAGIHELEQSPTGDERWRWTRPGKPFYVPVPSDDAARADGAVAIDGQLAPPGPVCRLVNKAGGYLRDDGVLGDRGAETPDDGRFDEPVEPFFVSGTAMALRADTFARVGPLAETFFAYYEDGDWCWRARLTGMRMAYDPTVTVEHRHSATSGGSGNPRVHFLAERNRQLTVIRNAPLRVAARHLTTRVAKGVATQLPWAVASRMRMSRQRTVGPDAVWQRWAGVDVVWDDGPCRS